jgi:cell division septation protein DedD
MEQHLKARLIGATILVVLAVELVPELLCGPKQSESGQSAEKGARPTRTYTIDLGGNAATGTSLEPGSAPVAGQPAPALPAVESPPTPQRGQQTADEAIDSDAVTTPPEPAIAPATAAESRPRPAAADALAPAAVAVPAPNVPGPQPSPAAKGGYSVQVGAFGSEATARKLAGELQAAGFPTYISPLARSGKTLHRVRVGPAADRAEADKIAARLKTRGLPASVVSGG